MFPTAHLPAATPFPPKLPLLYSPPGTALYCAADFRFYSSYDGHAETVKGTVIEGLDLWVSKNEHQRVLWPSMRPLSVACRTAQWDSTCTLGSHSGLLFGRGSGNSVDGQDKALAKPE